MEQRSETLRLEQRSVEAAPPEDPLPVAVTLAVAVADDPNHHPRRTRVASTPRTAGDVAIFATHVCVSNVARNKKFLYRRRRAPH